MKKSPIRISDLCRIKYLRELSISTNGKKIAYTIEWLDKKENKYFQNLYVIDSQNKIRHFIRGNKNVHNPKWSPDGKFISFIVTDKEKQNLWLIPTDGGEALQVTKLEGFFGNYYWTPDSNRIICEFTKKVIDKKQFPEKDKPPLYYYITKAWYKLDNAGMLPKEKPHIWKIDIKTGRMSQLTSSINGDTDPSISKDGRKIAFVSNREKNYEDKFLYVDLFIIDINGKKERLIKTPAGPKGNPVFSPDAKYIAYIGREGPENYQYMQSYIWLVPLKGGKAINLTKKFNLDIGDYIIDDCGNYAYNTIRFSQDGRYIFFQATSNGYTSLFCVEIKSHKIEKIIGEKDRIYAYDYDGKNTFALAIGNSVDPGNVYKWSKGELSKLTDINKDYLNSRLISKPEEFIFNGYRGRKIQGWILKPNGFNSRKKFPLIVQIHGGPHAAYGYSFFHEFQVLAGNGFLVFYSNPHGSVGYGEKFAKALDFKWGIPDSIDIMNAIKFLKKKYPVDYKNMAVIGGSYGGFMTNWLIGHTDIFKAAVTMRSVVNMISFPADDFGFIFPKEFSRTLWEKGGLEWFWNMSPLKYAPRIKTPLLIIHSEQDLRCLISQAEELFTALKFLKKDVEIVRFPGESHELSRHGTPRRREKRLEFILKFLNKHLKK